MGISKENTRTTITLPKDLKKQAEELAKKENRTFNNLVLTALIKYIKES